MQQNMQFDFDGLIQLLAHHLYSEKKVFIRELIQNSHDAIQRRNAVDTTGYRGRIDIVTNPSELMFTVVDDGIGMNKSELEDYLSSIGRSFTRTEKENIPGLIGQFGIGFLSAFVVAKKVEVITRKWNENEGWHWTNEGSKEYTIDSCEVQKSGTTVNVYLQSSAERGVIHEEEVRKTIRHYADMLLVPIYLNHSSTPVNTMHMPWEKTGLSQWEMQFNCRLYLEQTMSDRVLETIPVKIEGEVNAEGLLYITRTRVLVSESYREVRLFQNRMFICDNAGELLPKWASFISGVINSNNINPTAARDNFMRDEVAENLKKQLGDLVIKHFEELHTENPDRFSEIQKYHNIGIKAACYYYDEFFKKFANLIEWRTNLGNQDDFLQNNKFSWKTIPEILRLLPKHDGEPQRLPCFTTSNSANQYFQMADAANSVVIDASAIFEGALLEAYVKLPTVNTWLVHVDREEDPNVYIHLEEEEDARFRKFCEMMTKIIRIAGMGGVRAEARKFNPDTLPAVIRSDERTKGQKKATEILNDPNSSQDLRDMAVEMAKLARNASMKITINANNNLIIKLSQQNLDDQDVQQLIAGVYNNAILMNQELMTPSIAQFFHDQFQKLLMTNVEYIEERTSISDKENRLNKELEKLTIRKTPKPTHKIFFMMTPFSNTYAFIINAIRFVIEEKWGCQLYLATDKKYEDRILDNVHIHIDEADAFIAEITEANPNVMFELGACFSDRRNRPVVQLVNFSSSDEKKKIELPADLGSMIYINYAEKTDNDLTMFLDAEMRKDLRISVLINDKQRERYLPAGAIKKITKLSLSEETFFKLSEKFPTYEKWKNVEATHLKNILQKDDFDFAEAIINRIKSQ